jgi:cellulose synthase/poly-beta-1,6-N-acetylglucosamine synthase-like glycosyltransferase
VLIIPGPLGAFKRKAVLERGLCDKDTLTEDFDVTLKLLKSGRKVAEASSKSYTTVPTTLMDLYRQKSRWTKGAIQTLVKHKDILSNTKHGIVRIFLFPIKLLSLLVMPIFDAILIGFTAQAILSNSLIFPAIWFGLFIYFYSLLSIVAIMVQKQKDSTLLLYIPFMSFVYRQIIDIIIIRTIIDVLLQKWNKGSYTREK